MRIESRSHDLAKLVTFDLVASMQHHARIEAEIVFAGEQLWSDSENS